MMRTTYTLPHTRDARLFETVRPTDREIGDACREIVDGDWLPMIATTTGAHPYPASTIVGMVDASVIDRVNTAHEYVERCAGDVRDIAATLREHLDEAIGYVTDDGETAAVLREALRAVDELDDVRDVFDDLANAWGGPEYTSEAGR